MQRCFSPHPPREKKVGRRLIPAVISVACLACVSVVNADPALSFTGQSGVGVRNNRTAGYTFTVDSTMAVTQLGLADLSGDGNEEIRPIGLWDSGGSLLATVVMPAGSIGTLVGDFRYLPLDSPVFLNAGETYTVGATYQTSMGGVFWEASGLTTIPDFNFGTNRLSNEGTGFVKPLGGTGGSRDAGFFGPNLDLGPIETQLLGRVPALEFSGESGIGVSSRTVGYTFTVDQTMALADLGLIDVGQDGNEEVREIGIWDGGGALLASVVMPMGTAGVLDGDFRYLALADPLLLNPGETYTVGAHYTTSAGGVFMRATGFSSIDGFNFGTNVASVPDTGFGQPGVMFDPSFNPGFFGPNLRFAVVPEPGAMTLAALASLGVAGCVRRRKQSASN